MTPPHAERAALGGGGDLELSAAVARVMSKVEADHADEQQAAQPARPSYRTHVLAALLTMVLVATTRRAVVADGARPSVSPAAAERAARFQLWLASRNVDAFYDSAGVWPTTVGAIGVDTGTVSYAKTVTGYVVAVEEAGRRWSHESGDSQSKALLDATADSVLQGVVR